MSRKAVVFVTLLSLLCCLLLTGCNALGIDVENQLRPPKNNGDQEALQAALDEYINENSEKGEGNRYTLKYPSEGRYLSAFILLDNLHAQEYISADKQATPLLQQLNGEYCLAFYRRDIETAMTRINLLKKDDGIWRTIADVEGQGTEIAQVDFADFNGDGFPELVVGWDMYNTKDKRLVVYGIDSDLQVLSEEMTCTSLVLSDLTADGKDDLLLVEINTGKRVGVRLISYMNHRFTTVGQTQLDMDIQRIVAQQNAIFAGGERGVYLDASKDPDTTITELVVWKDDRLQAPLCDDKTLINTVSAREFSISFRDIDGDGTIEWPQIVPLVGQTNASRQPFFLRLGWYYYDVTESQVAYDFDSIVNTQDRYSVRISERWPEEFSVIYHEEPRILEFQDLSTETPTSFLKLQTTTTGRKSDLEENMVYFDETDSLYFAVWYDSELNMTMEELRYLFSIL